MRTKLVFGIIVSALVCLSFTFNKEVKKEKPSDNVVSRTTYKEPLGGFALEDK